jgi:hypothetical protein
MKISLVEAGRGRIEIENPIDRKENLILKGFVCTRKTYWIKTAGVQTHDSWKTEIFSGR